ncbi:MAG: hypothetical protein HXX81_03225 [Campylobacterales bacterium]|nr:hypothetical protein [Campylobacterales bacterium]
MKAEYHSHVKDDLLRLEPILRSHIILVLKTGFYNISNCIEKCANIYSFKTESGVEILYHKNKNYILVLSINKIN